MVEISELTFVESELNGEVTPGLCFDTPDKQFIFPLEKKELIRLMVALEEVYQDYYPPNLDIDNNSIN